MNMKRPLSFLLAIAMVMASFAFSELPTRHEPAPIVNTGNNSGAFFDNEILNLLNVKNIHDFTFYLSEVVGPRHWGTPQEYQAAKAMKERFEKWGIPFAQIDRIPFNIRSITEDTTPDPAAAARTFPTLVIHDHIDNRAPNYNHPRVFDKGISAFYGPTIIKTGPKGVTGTIVHIGSGSAGSYARLGVGTNRIALIDIPFIPMCDKYDSGFPGGNPNAEEHPHRVPTTGENAHKCPDCGKPRTVAQRSNLSAPFVRDAYARAVAAGAVAVLFNVPEPDVRIIGGSAGVVPPGTDRRYDGTKATLWPAEGSSGSMRSWANIEIPHATTAGIPYGFVPDFHAKELLLRENTVVTYTVDNYDHIYNVVAKIPASNGDPNAPIVFFTAHLDTVGATCGANDNAAGVALITEIARVYWELSKAGLLGAQVIVAGVGAEESGLIGSWAIAEADIAWRPKGAVTGDELKRFVAVYNFDCVASSDAWNAGMTINLRQWYNSGNVPPVMDLVATNTFAAAQRLYNMPIFDMDKRNPVQCPATSPFPVKPKGKYVTVEELRAHGWGIKVTNGGSSDHGPFGQRHNIPNANVTFRIAHDYPTTRYEFDTNGKIIGAGVPGSINWNAVVQLESRYHTIKDIFEENYCETRMEVAVRIAAASSYAIARVAR